MKSSRKEDRRARRAEADRRAGERAAARAKAKGQGRATVRIFIGQWFRSIFSNLRFSLTLRIALHYSGQLLHTTVLILLAFTVAYGIAQIPSVNQTLDAVAAVAPADGNAYTAGQLTGLPLNGAYLLDEPLPDDVNGFIDAV
jgi:hypothetical protein